MTIGNANTEGYQIMAEILVTVRRIVHRGLEKVAGKSWYLDALPPDLFERLVARKENEVSIDRFDGEYQELISFASLDDLAEMIEYNEKLAKLLAGVIEPDDESMVGRLREVEALRLKLAATAPFDDDDLEKLIEYHQDLKRALARRKKQAAEPEPPKPASEVEPPSEKVDEAEPPGEEIEEIFEADEDAAEEPEEPEEADESEAEELQETGENEEIEELQEIADASDASQYETEIAPVEELGQSDVVDINEYGTVAARLEPVTGKAAEDGADSSDGSASDELGKAQWAMSVDDDREALRALRSEVMSVAESVLQNDPAQDFPIWEAMGTAGWYDRKRDELGLDAVERFYAVAEGVLERRLAGHSADEVKAFVEESSFSGLLLELRDLFLRHEL